MFLKLPAVCVGILHMLYVQPTHCLQSGDGCLQTHFAGSQQAETFWELSEKASVNGDGFGPTGLLNTHDRSEQQDPYLAYALSSDMSATECTSHTQRLPGRNTVLLTGTSRGTTYSNNSRRLLFLGTHCVEPGCILVLLRVVRRVAQSLAQVPDERCERLHADGAAVTPAARITAADDVREGGNPQLLVVLLQDLQGEGTTH